MEESFVELWQQYACLYDVSSRDYHDRIKKDKCWRSIAEALHQSGEFNVRLLNWQVNYQITQYVLIHNNDTVF